jgi:hypothetical protein
MPTHAEAAAALVTDMAVDTADWLLSPPAFDPRAAATRAPRAAIQFPSSTSTSTTAVEELVGTSQQKHAKIQAVTDRIRDLMVHQTSEPQIQHCWQLLNQILASIQSRQVLALEQQPVASAAEDEKNRRTCYRTLGNARSKHQAAAPREECPKCRAFFAVHKARLGDAEATAMVEQHTSAKAQECQSKQIVVSHPVSIAAEPESSLSYTFQYPNKRRRNAEGPAWTAHEMQVEPHFRAATVVCIQPFGIIVDANDVPSAGHITAWGAGPPRGALSAASCATLSVGATESQHT